MNVAEAIEQVRRVGVVEGCGGILKLRFPERERATLQSAINTLRGGKAEALALLVAEAEPSKPPELAFAAPVSEIRPLEDVLRGRAVELYLASGDRLFLVADEEDARLLGAPRGTVYTATEVQRVIQIGDPAVVAEIHQWKRRFDGSIRETL